MIIFGKWFLVGVFLTSMFLAYKNYTNQEVTAETLRSMMVANAPPSCEFVDYANSPKPNTISGLYDCSPNGFVLKDLKR